MNFEPRCRHGNIRSAEPCRDCDERDSLRARVAELERENATLLTQRNESLSLVGAIVSAQGGEIRIPDTDLMVGYAFESHRDPLHHETILRVVAD